MIKKLLFLIMLCSVVVLLSSCGLLSILLATVDSSAASLPKFDLNGAKAVGILDSDSRSLGNRATIDELAGFEGFVKLLDSGYVVPAMQLDESAYYINATVGFIMRGSDGSVYIGYQNQGIPFFSQLINQQMFAQLIRIYPDSTFDDSHVEVIWPPQEVRVDAVSPPTIEMYQNWNGDAPVVKSPDGSFYFKVSSWGGGFDTGNMIYQYKPDINELKRITPENLGLYVETFKVDSTGRLYFTESGNLRTIKANVTGTGTIFRADDVNSINNSIRSYDITKQGELILQTQTALIRIRMADDSNQELSREYVLRSDTSTYYDLIDRYATGNPAAILRLRPTAEYWSNSASDYCFNPYLLDETSGALLLPAFLERLAGKFKGEFSMKPVLETFLKSSSPITSTLDDHSLYYWLNDSTEAFLGTYFNGTLWIDYLESKGFVDGAFNIYDIGSFTWLSDGSLGALRASWWSGSSTGSTEFYQVLNPQGEIDFARFIPTKPSASKAVETRLVGDVMYYTYNVLNSFGNSTGEKRIGSVNLLSKEERENLLPDTFHGTELRSWAVADNNAFMYAMGWNTTTNEVVNVKVDLLTGESVTLDSPYLLSNLTVIE